MKEQPNLIYIKQIAGNDTNYQNKLLTIIKKEFPEEKAQFLLFYNAKKYQQSAEMIHKIKHKINILGLEKGYIVASDFETQLKNDKTQLFNQFLLILKHIETFLKDL